MLEHRLSGASALLRTWQRLPLLRKWQPMEWWPWHSNLEKAGSTLRSSRAVPHPSTNRALCRLTSEFGRDPVHSTRYGRQRHPCSPCPRLSGSLRAPAAPRVAGDEAWLTVPRSHHRQQVSGHGVCSSRVPGRKHIWWAPSGDPQGPRFGGQGAAPQVGAIAQLAGQQASQLGWRGGCGLGVPRVW